MAFSKIFSHKLNIIHYEWREYLHWSLATLKCQKYEYLTTVLTFYLITVLDIVSFMFFQ